MSAATVPEASRAAIREAARKYAEADAIPKDQFPGDKGLHQANLIGYLGGYTVQLLDALEEAEGTECESCGFRRPDCGWAGGEEGGYVCGSCRASAKERGALLKAVEPFTVDGGVSCGGEEADTLVATYEAIIGGVELPEATQ